MVDDTTALVPPPEDEEAEKPHAVTEAERSIRRWGLTLAGTGTVGTFAYWLSVLELGILFPLQWWLIFLVALVALFFFPPNRGPRNAREILRRWDDLKIETLLEEGGASPDPRVRVAEEMAQRVMGHPRADADVRQVASDLLATIRQTAQDRRTVRLLQQSGALQDLGAQERTLSDVLDFVSAREGELLGSLEKLHRAVIQRDAAGVDELSSEARGLMAQLEAEAEVERLLRGEEKP